MSEQMILDLVELFAGAVANAEDGEAAERAVRIMGARVLAAVSMAEGMPAGEAARVSLLTVRGGPVVA